MIKKFITLLLGSFILCLTVFADNLNLGSVVEKLPELKQGIAYSFSDDRIEYISTVDIMNKEGFNLEIGYSTTDKAVVVISYELIKLKDYIAIPILSLVECNLGFYGGYSRLGITDGNNEFDFGMSATLLKVKF